MNIIDCPKCGFKNWRAVWLSEDLEGFRCDICGDEEVDIYMPEDNKKQTFVEWLEDLVLQLEDVEAPLADNEYDKGYNAGSLDVQNFVVNKLKYALEIYKKEKINEQKN
jgi:hypothetical protein